MELLNAHLVTVFTSLLYPPYFFPRDNCYIEFVVYLSIDSLCKHVYSIVTIYFYTFSGLLLPFIHKWQHPLQSIFYSYCYCACMFSRLINISWQWFKITNKRRVSYKDVLYILQFIVSPIVSTLIRMDIYVFMY